MSQLELDLVTQSLLHFFLIFIRKSLFWQLKEVPPVNFMTI